MRIRVFPCAAGLVALAGVAHAQTFRPGAPEQHLPPQITQLTGFGERAVWSPDGKRIAFMSKSFGDAFEDRSAHQADAIAHRPLPPCRVPARALPAQRRLPPHRRTRLQGHPHDARPGRGVLAHEGRRTYGACGARAASERRRRHLAHAHAHRLGEHHGQYPDSLAEGESVIHMADVVYDATGTLGWRTSASCCARSAPTAPSRRRTSATTTASWSTCATASTTRPT